MATRQLQNALSAQRVFQRLFACSALCADQGAFASRLWARRIDHGAEFVLLLLEAHSRRRGRGRGGGRLLLQTRGGRTVMQPSERGEASGRL